MLRISRRTDYAVRIIIAAAQEPAGAMVPAMQIGEQMAIPPSFLFKVIGDLKRGGLLLTATGRHGGVRLTRPADRITLLEVVEAVEGPVLLDSTHARTHDEQCPHPVWAHIQQVLEAEMGAVSIADMARSGYEPC
jgi:Rrf2 family protein